MYDTPASLFGSLSAEMWRACRLVVDTGLHSLGWDRQRAVDFMAEQSGRPAVEVASEVDRYITWPGQACGYQIGKIKITQLRAKAEAALAALFDVRSFHDTIVATGSAPLWVLEQQVDQWVETLLNTTVKSS